MSKILLCGYGAIGKRMCEEYSKMGELYIYDPNCSYNPEINLYNSFDIVKTFGKFDFVILSVPTPLGENGLLDCNIVSDMVNKTKDIADTIIIRSTVNVGFTETLGIDNIVFCPEFYGTTQHQTNNDFLILAGKKEYTHKVAQLYYKIKNGNFRINYYENFRVAEMIKLVSNNFLAMKVVFFNNISAHCKETGIDYDDVRQGLLLDDRIGASHTIVYDDKPYYDSHCFNKDCPSFANQFNDKLIKKSIEINNLRMPH